MARILTDTEALSIAARGVSRAPNVEVQLDSGEWLRIVRVVSRARGHVEVYCEPCQEPERP